MDKKIKYALIAAGLSAILFVVMGIPTALVPNPFIGYARMIEPTTLDYFFLTAVSVLLAVLVSLKLYFKSEKPLGAKGIIGGIVGFLSFSCPVCNVLLVAVLGSATVLTFIEPLRPILGVVSVSVLSYLIYRTLKCKECNT